LPGGGERGFLKKGREPEPGVAVGWENLLSGGGEGDVPGGDLLLKGRFRAGAESEKFEGRRG